MTLDIVIPTIGRPSLATLLDRLAGLDGATPGRVLLVDDRPGPVGPLLPDGPPPAIAAQIREIRGRAAGPAAARNAGWRASDADWIAFLDDDVVPEGGWLRDLRQDVASAGPDIGGVQGRIVVPRPRDRRPTDWERNVAGLESARWATADMAYRRAALAAVGGFDERFPRAYREDADLALRVIARGWRLTVGRRTVLHPARPVDRWVSVRLQAGNADDALMQVTHGRGWRARAGVPRGRRPAHVIVTAAAAFAIAAVGLRRPRTAAAAAAVWLAGTAELAWARIAPGPRTGREITTMLASSAAIPPAATYHWIRGWVRVAAARRPSRRAVPKAVLLDRDGTLIVDVPYNGDPERVVPMPTARAALDRLRAAGIRVAVVSNQSGIGRGMLRPEDVEAVNRRVERVLGPLGPWLVCPHAPEAGCRCRKPSPELVLRAAHALGVRPRDCVLIGDTGADMDAARAAGARAVLVPNAVTLPAEIDAAPDVAPDLVTAVDRLLGSSRRAERGTSRETPVAQEGRP